MKEIAKLPTETARDYASYLGVAPHTKPSGKISFLLILNREPVSAKTRSQVFWV